MHISLVGCVTKGGSFGGLKTRGLRLLEEEF